MTYKIQTAFFEKWDGEGESTGLVTWEDEPSGETFQTGAAALKAADRLEADGVRCRVVRVGASAERQAWALACAGRWASCARRSEAEGGEYFEAAAIGEWARCVVLLLEALLSDSPAVVS